MLLALQRGSAAARQHVESFDKSGEAHGGIDIALGYVEAETVRDVHLAASGLLCDKIGGPSVRPPLPSDIAALGYASSIKWEESKGEDRYRRGMYIFFQRTVPYPMLVTFDEPDSNNSCTRRERSNTPLQALTLWNDPVFFDCARALSKRVAGERTLNTRLKRAFELCLARPPTRAEHAASPRPWRRGFRCRGW